MLLKDQIQIHREAAGLTRREFAAMLTPPVSEQCVIWWETGEHRPRTQKIKNINEVLKIKLDVTEKGPAMRPDVKGRESAFDPEHMRIAIAISHLPKKHRDAIVTLIDIGDKTSLSKTSL